MEKENGSDSPVALISGQPKRFSRFKDDQDHPQFDLVKERLKGNLQNLKKDQFEWINKSDKQIDEQVTCNCDISFKCIREHCRNLCVSKTFNYAFLVFLGIFLISCLLWDPNQNEELSDVMEIVQLVCNSIFIIFFLVKAIQWQNQSLLWLILDITTSIAGIIAFPLNDTSFETARYFKAYRALKIIFLIKQIKYFYDPAYSLMTSLAKIGNLLIPILFIIYMYAVIGLYSFTDLQYQKCRDPSNLNLSQNWTVYTSQIYLCGIRQCPVINDVQYQCLNPIFYGVQPNKQQLVNIDQGYGLLHYQNIFYAFLSTLKQTYVTGSSRLIIFYKQVLSQIYIYFYYYTYIYLISYIYLNIFYSQIITAQMQLDQQQKQAANDQNKGAVISNDRQPESVKILHKQQNVKKIDNRKMQDLQVKDIQEDIQFMQNSQIGLRSQIKKDIKVSPIKLNHKTSNQDQLDLTQKNLALTSPRQIKLSPRDNQQIIDGTLVLNNARIYNVFQDVDHLQKDVKYDSTFSECQQIQKDIPQDATLYTQDPENYKKYLIFNNIIIILCCINLSLDYGSQSQGFKFVVDCIDFGFYCLFMFELGIKIIWQRLVLRRIQNYTILELVIAGICTCGVLYQAIICQDVTDFFSAANYIENVLRSFKYLRIILAVLQSTYFSEARLILESTFRSLYRIKHVVGLWMLIVIIFGIMGFHLHSYRTTIDEDGDFSQSGSGFQVSFDGVFNSIIFTMLTFYNEQWDYLMFQQYLGGGVLVVIWQLLSITIGLVLFSKYFMALLMVELDNLIDKSYENHDQFNQLLESKQQKEEDQITQRNQSVPNRINDSTKIHRRQTLKIKKQSSSFQRQKIDSSQNGLDTFGKIQYTLRKIIDHFIYKTVFGIMIGLTCLVLINLHPHVDRTSAQAQSYLVLDIVCKVYFMLDLIVNLMGFGFYQSQNSYFKKSYLNWANVIIIIVEIISFTPLGSNYIFLKIQKIKILRICYALQMQYRRDWNMRMTFLSFMKLLPKVITLLLLTILMYSFFALLLVKIYKNHFYSCSDYSASASTIYTKWDCYDWGGDWVQMQINTSNLFNSTLFLFLVATTQGWITLMQPMMNFVGEDYQPILDTNKYICIFFVCFFFFGNLIMLNVFVGLSVSNFKRLKQIVTGESKLSKSEKMWLQIKTQIYNLEPALLERKPQNFIRGLAYRIATHLAYKIIQGITLISFLIIMSLYHTNMPDQQRIALRYVQYTYVGIYSVQYLIQFLAYGIRKDYIRQMIFKNIVFFYAISFMIVQQTTTLTLQASRIMGGVFITLQILRYLSLFHEFSFARKLLNSLMTVFPQTSNIMLMIAVTLLIYAIIGMELFAFLKPSSQLDQFNQNYTNFSSALFALVKFSTMQSPINQITDAGQELKPNFICNEISSYEQFLQYGQTGCGSKASSYIFFLSFHVFYSLLLMSTFMAIVADSYGAVKREQSAKITKQVLYKVQRAWSKYDQDASGYIPYRQFWMFTAKLLLIYVGKQHQQAAQQQFRELFASKEDFLKRMSIPIYENQDGILCFQFNQVIEALTKAYLKDNLGSVKSRKADKMFKQRQANSEVAFKKSQFTSSHVATLIVLKSGLKHWRQLALNQGEVFKYGNAMKKFNMNMVQKQ